jgi:uncharacterized protein with NRDE domain
LAAPDAVAVVCLVVFAWKSHPEYQLILAANRDEFHGRPAQEAHWWPDLPDVLGGRDLQAGGTWLAVARSGRFATVTNYREQQRAQAGLRSRGEIVTNFVTTDIDAKSFVSAIAGEPYAGVSVLTADDENMCYTSNRGDEPLALAPGIYGLSNASLDTPWSKITRTKEALTTLMESDNVNTTELLRLLADQTPAASAEVDNSDLPFKVARALTAPFIISDTYGTRCSTVLLIANDGRIEFCERRFDPGGTASGDSNFSFRRE